MQEINCAPANFADITARTRPEAMARHYFN